MRSEKCTLLKTCLFFVCEQHTATLRVRMMQATRMVRVETPAAAVVQSMMGRSKRKMQISLDSPIHSLVVIQKWYVYIHIVVE